MHKPSPRIEAATIRLNRKLQQSLIKRLKHTKDLWHYATI